MKKKDVRNERTSRRVAKIAARILATEGRIAWFSWDEIQAVAASALTQTRDKLKRDLTGVPKGRAKRKAKRRA